MCELFHSLWGHFSPLSTYQQQRRVDVDVFKHNELFLGFDGHHPGSVQLGFHPVPHAAVLPLEGSGQSPEEREIRHVGGLSGTVLHAVSSCFYSSSTTGAQQSGALLKGCGGGKLPRRNKTPAASFGAEGGARFNHFTHAQLVPAPGGEHSS